MKVSSLWTLYFYIPLQTRPSQLCKHIRAVHPTISPFDFGCDFCTQNSYKFSSVRWMSLRQGMADRLSILPYHAFLQIQFFQIFFANFWSQKPRATYHDLQKPYHWLAMTCLRTLARLKNLSRDLFFRTRRTILSFWTYWGRSSFDAPIH